jgi:hypothetical protein
VATLLAYTLKDNRQALRTFLKQEVDREITILITEVDLIILKVQIEWV